MLSWSDSMLGQASYGFLSVFVPIAVQSCLHCILPRDLGEEESATHAHTQNHTKHATHTITLTLSHPPIRTLTDILSRPHQT